MSVDVPTGTVRWHAQVAHVDSVDVDALPDLDAPNGTVTFTPGTTELRFVDGEDPATVFLVPLVYGLGSDGIMRDLSGNDAVTLPADAGNPQRWTWTCSVNLDGIKWKPFSFHLSPGEDLDLTQLSPVPAADGTWYRIGPAGPIGPVGPQGPPGAINGMPDATATVKGAVRLAGDLGGHADAPTVPALASKANTADLALVATSGKYTDLAATPTLATVATTGSYNDLTNKPAAYTDENAQDAAAALFANGAHTGITFTYNDSTAAISGAVKAQVVGLTQAAYTALATKDATVLYCITG